jgi:hypothetical protein
MLDDAPLMLPAKQLINKIYYTVAAAKEMIIFITTWERVSDLNLRGKERFRMEQTTVILNLKIIEAKY